MSVKRIRCTDDVQKRGIRDLRELMKADMPIGMHWKLQKILEKFELSHQIIKELLVRAERYQQAAMAQKGKT